jgi:hypothetical protein
MGASGGLNRRVLCVDVLAGLMLAMLPSALLQILIRAAQGALPANYFYPPPPAAFCGRSIIITSVDKHGRGPKDENPGRNLKLGF